MKILLDMNLSPLWRDVLEGHGHVCIHWSDVGPNNSPDATVMQFARDHGFVVLTHDLDFGAILAGTNASGPSVIQIRTQDILPQAMESTLTGALRQYEREMVAGALIVIDKTKSRVRILPLGIAGE